MIIPAHALFRIAVLAALTGLVGCSGAASEPYFLGRYLPGTSGATQISSDIRMNDPVTGRPTFSVCYNSVTHTAEQVRALVRRHCADPRPIFNKSDLYSCSLASPVRVTYTCSELSRTAEEARPNLQRNDSFLGTITLY